jgi:hypothetical protein
VPVVYQDVVLAGAPVLALFEKWGFTKQRARRILIRPLTFPPLPTLLFSVALDVGVVALPLVVFKIFIGDDAKQLLHLRLRERSVCVRREIECGDGLGGVPDVGYPTAGSPERVVFAFWGGGSP